MFELFQQMTSSLEEGYYFNLKTWFFVLRYKRHRDGTKEYLGKSLRTYIKVIIALIPVFAVLAAIAYTNILKPLRFARRNKMTRADMRTLIWERQVYRLPRKRS